MRLFQIRTCRLTASLLIHISLLIPNFHTMLLETLKSLVMRSRKRKELNIQTQSLPGLGKKPRSKPTTTSSNNADASAHLGNAQDPDARPLFAGEQAITQPSAYIQRPVSLYRASSNNLKLFPKRTELRHQQFNRNHKYHRFWWNR